MGTSPNQIRVILADDHAVVRSGIRQFLECAKEIRVVAEANNGKQAEMLIEEPMMRVCMLWRCSSLAKMGMS
jgi:two-component system, NarL family, invasion response regulator UvrY